MQLATILFIFFKYFHDHNAALHIRAAQLICNLKIIINFIVDIRKSYYNIVNQLKWFLFHIFTQVALKMDIFIIKKKIWKIAAKYYHSRGNCFPATKIPTTYIHTYIHIQTSMWHNGRLKSTQFQNTQQQQ